MPVSLTWTAQPAAPGALRGELEWRSSPGTAGRLAAVLKPWTLLRFEVSEQPSAGVDGERFSHTPSLGLFRTATSANGDIVVAEDRLRSLLTAHPREELLADAIARLLGSAWDAELEPYRSAGDGAPVTWLHRVG